MLSTMRFLGRISVISLTGSVFKDNNREMLKRSLAKMECTSFNLGRFGPCSIPDYCLVCTSKFFRQNAYMSSVKEPQRHIMVFTLLFFIMMVYILAPDIVYD